jgi:transglutaminase-like putative cysteine protease
MPLQSFQLYAIKFLYSNYFKWFTKVNLGGSLTWDPPEGMDEFLSSSELCDFKNPIIIEKAKNITDGAGIPREAAEKIFLFVRDEVLFGLDNFDVKASETLSRGYGQCVNKANLQVALLRSIDIPARYHRVVLSRDCLKGVVPNITFNSIPEKIW